MKKLIIFDLDGTLLNTIADLAHSTNYALNKLGYPTHDVEKYNFMVGNGINKLFERALPEGCYYRIANGNPVTTEDFFSQRKMCYIKCFL